MDICLERSADLHMAQLMPLPLTVSCFSKIQIGFTFLILAHPGSPGQRAIKRVCVYQSSISILLHLCPLILSNSLSSSMTSVLFSPSLQPHFMNSSPPPSWIQPAIRFLPNQDQDRRISRLSPSGEAINWTLPQSNLASKTALTSRLTL